jgi:hypothetical protein
MSIANTGHSEFFGHPPPFLFSQKHMSSLDEPQPEQSDGIPTLPSVQERRMQLEAFQTGTGVVPWKL